MSIDLKNKKIVISAGGSGIGWSSAKIFLEKGATVYLCEINATFLNKCKKHKLNNKKLFVFQIYTHNFKIYSKSVVALY